LKILKRRANEIGTASNSAEKKGSPSEGVAEGGGWGEAPAPEQSSVRGKNSHHARAEVRQQADKLRRFRRLGIKTSKQNNFQFLLKEKFGRSGANQAFFVQKRFELRSAIATSVKLKSPFKKAILVLL